MQTLTNELRAKLVSDYVSRKITKEEFFAHYEVVNEHCCLQILQEALSKKDAAIMQEATLLIFGANCFSPIYTESLCSLIKERWHYSHEDLASILQTIADPSSVNCLYEATCLHFDYLDYDDTYQFARKCIKALAAIKSIEAINKLKLLSDICPSEIRQYAVKELRYKGAT